MFQDPSLEDMTLQYPIDMEEMQNIVGVGQGKAKRYGQPFLDLIIQYVEENNISIVIDKKHVVSSNTEVDITNDIVERLNKELPSLNLK